MNTAALQTKDIAKTNRRPVWILHAAIRARAVSRQGFHHRLVFGAHSIKEIVRRIDDHPRAPLRFLLTGKARS